MSDAGLGVPVRNLGVPTEWHPHGSRSEILADLGLTAQDIARQITEWVSSLAEQTESTAGAELRG